MAREQLPYGDSQGREATQDAPPPHTPKMMAEGCAKVQMAYAPVTPCLLLAVVKQRMLRYRYRPRDTGHTDTAQTGAEWCLGLSNIA